MPKEMVEIGKVFLERLLTVGGQQLSRVLQLQLIEAVEHGVDALLLYALGDGPKQQERQRQDCDHRERHSDIE